MTDQDKLAKLKQRHEDYIARVKASGAKTAFHTMPCCGGTMEDRLANAGETWDTLATCPHCGVLYMKITTADTITALLPEST